MIKLENLLITSFGIITVLAFISMLVYGRLFESIYSFLFVEVSYLISPYTPYKDMTVLIYYIYSFYLILFSLTLFFRFRNIYAKIASLYLLTSAAIGILILQYPMDPRGISQSEAGIAHITILLFMSFYTASSLLLFGYFFKKSNNLYWLSKFSSILCLVIVAIGVLTGVFALFSMPHFVGLTEKLPIALFLGWIFLTGIAMLRSDKRIKHYFW